MPDIISFETKEQLARELAVIILAMVEKATRSGEEYNIALSGGSTPGILFKHLAEFPGSTDAGIWEKVNFYWVDERCVPPDSPDSNYRMAHKTLLQHLSMPEENVFRIIGENFPRDEATRYGRLIYAQLPRRDEYPVFDLILLGMGGDGHTASIFSDQMDLLTSKEICAVGYHPQTKQARITLTGTVINHAKNVFFLVTGEDKATTLERIIGKESPDLKYPASHIFPSHGILRWFLDYAAASRL